jgi:methyl-accepting chemotaxis protein
MTDTTHHLEALNEGMQALVSGARHMNELLLHISTMAAQRSSGGSRDSSAVPDPDRMTQQITVLVEHATTAAMAVRDRADGLAVEVARFRPPAPQ